MSYTKICIVLKFERDMGATFPATFRPIGGDNCRANEMAGGLVCAVMEALAQSKEGPIDGERESCQGFLDVV